jgi:lipid A ethanolaminephosphotransferase
MSEFSRQCCWYTSPVKFVVIVSILNIALYNWPLYSFATAHLDSLSVNGIRTLFTLCVLIFMLTAITLFLLLVVSQHLLKPFCLLMAISNAIALYFVFTYQVVLDKTMMGNIQDTNFAEAADFLHPKLLLWLIIFGFLPCCLLLRIHIQRTSRLRIVLPVLATLVIGLSWTYYASDTWLWIDKNAKKLGGIVMPWAYIINMVRYQTAHLTSSQRQILLPSANFTTDEKTVIILVIGESARTQNFSLYGYHRPTNPLLTEAGIIPLHNTVACATYTTAALQCILSHRNPGSPFADQYEPLPSYLKRHGADVIWRTNNWGEPDLKVNSYRRAEDLRHDCRGPGCENDEVLLTGLKKRIASSTYQKIFIVLHQTGSHGPSYFKKYPAPFEVFKPVCKSVELHQCTPEELINAYDNSILYTDYFLNQVVQLLKELSDTSAMLMYISDHGESLGEHGLYLHGTPFSLAPEQQKNIPFMVWMSPVFMASNKITAAQLYLQKKHSQTNVFHSIMGAFDMASDAYNMQLDIFNQGAGQD